MSRRSPLLAPDYQKADVRDSVATLEQRPKLPSFTVVELQGIPTAALEAGMTAFCRNESGGAQPVFFDGSQWRRMTDRAAIS